MTDINLEKEVEIRASAENELYLSCLAIAKFFSEKFNIPSITHTLTFLEHNKWTEHITDEWHEVVYNDHEIDDQYNFFVNNHGATSMGVKRWEKDGYVLFAGWNHSGDPREDMYIFKLENKVEELSFDD